LDGRAVLLIDRCISLGGEVLVAGLRYLRGVVTLELDVGKCVGCGLCAAVCPHGVFAVEGGKARLSDRDACMECGACARNCAPGAIRVRAGVGCAAGILAGLLGGTEPCCGGPQAGACCPDAAGGEGGRKTSTDCTDVHR
jgi:ferredoxin